MAGDSQPNYVRFELEADDGEFRSPPTTHFIATVDDLTDTLDYDSEDIDGMDDNAKEEEAQAAPFTGQWTTTSSYDVYMVDTPKDNSGDDKENLVEGDPLRHNQSAGVSGGALNHAAARTATPAQETTALQTVPKT